jgi:hypothetical protein
MITEEQYQNVATSLSCEVAAIKAVQKVESSGKGFLSNGNPKILFEGHIFWKQLLRAGKDPSSIQVGNEDILYPVWNLQKVRPFYNLDQYQRLNKAKAILEDAALKSASWGAFQIMGFNHKSCGFDTVGAFVLAQSNEFEQLNCFCNYLKNSHLDVNLRNNDWKGFARGYNGSDYWKNQYDTKLKSAYETFRGPLV